MHSLFLFALLGSLGVPEDSASTVLGAHWNLLGFNMRIGVCVFGLSDVFRELLIGMLGCVWFYLVLSCYFLTTGLVCWPWTDPNYNTGTYQVHFGLLSFC